MGAAKFVIGYACAPDGYDIIGTGVAVVCRAGIAIAGAAVGAATVNAGAAAAVTFMGSSCIFALRVFVVAGVLLLLLSPESHATDS
mmetsp:Transcript_65570/g.182299  ORF Transcript_65570/g.182299 Transcript_65570/m.182299 type:complete len:86 (-) Transcript_65570:1093-1350(-)